MVPIRTCIQLKNANQDDLPVEFHGDDVRYSESLVEYFLKEFTRKGDRVFDPFAGYGTTLLVAETLERVPLGIEYDEERVRYIQSRLKKADSVLHGDARQLKLYHLPPFNFSITSPPYMGENDIENPFTAYTTTGNGYQGYLEDIRNIYRQMKEIMAPDAKAVIEVANIKQKGNVTTLAWDIGKEISRVLDFEGEMIIDWDHYGYGYTHSYCLIFRKPN